MYGRITEVTVRRGATVLIRWIVIYSVDSTIQRSNNQCLQVNKLKHKYATWVEFQVVDI